MPPEIVTHVYDSRITKLFLFSLFVFHYCEKL